MEKEKFGNNYKKGQLKKLAFFYLQKIQKITVPVSKKNQIKSPVFKSNLHTMKPNNPISI